MAKITRQRQEGRRREGGKGGGEEDGGKGGGEEDGGREGREDRGRNVWRVGGGRRMEGKKGGVADLVFHRCDIAMVPPVYRVRKILTTKVDRSGIDR